MPETAVRVAVHPDPADIATDIDPDGAYRTIDIGVDWGRQVSIYVSNSSILDALQAALTAIRADFDAADERVAVSAVATLAVR